MRASHSTSFRYERQLTGWTVQKLGNIGHFIYWHVVHLGSQVDITSVIIMDVAHSVFDFLRFQVLLEKGERTIKLPDFPTHPHFKGFTPFCMFHPLTLIKVSVTLYSYGYNFKHTSSKWLLPCLILAPCSQNG